MYTEKEKIYSGPLSIVYKSIEEKTGAIVALKVVDVDFVVKPHNIKREIEFLDQVKDRADKYGILQYITSYSEVDDKVIVTEYYETDLSKLIASRLKRSTRYDWVDPTKNTVVYKNEFPLEMAQRVFFEIAESLRFLHEECRIIHRDIKPSNIFFKRVDGSSRAVIGDYGIIYNCARQTTNDGEEKWQEKFTDVSTGVYKAPELCFGKTDYDSSIDIWSLGVLVSKMYSKDGQECLGEYKSDLGLIDSIFLHLGTPVIAAPPGATTDDEAAVYWPEMGNNSQFKVFLFEKYPRMAVQDLLPRCTEASVRRLWGLMMVYESGSRLKARDISSTIHQ